MAIPTMLGLKMAWMVVEDLESSITFYTQQLGLTLAVHDAEHGWAELKGPEGMRLGLSQGWEGLHPGDNAICVLMVEDLEEARSGLPKQILVGEVVEVPGHVRLQMIRDASGNHFQLCQRTG